MTTPTEPRKVPMWQFFNDNVEASAPARLGRLDELCEGNQDAAQLFVDALRGCSRVLDVGCGTGLPSLYVAPHVDGFVGVDAAPNMVAAARRNASRLGLTNASFVIYEQIHHGCVLEACSSLCLEGLELLLEMPSGNTFVL